MLSTVNNPIFPLFSRRSFLKISAAIPATLAMRLKADDSAVNAEIAQVLKKHRIGLELYSVRNELAKDLPNTLKTVAQIGYEVVEFYAPYFKWAPAYAKDVRTQMDDLNLR